MFITFRLAGSLPKEVLERLFEEAAREIFAININSNDFESKEKLRILQKRMFGRWDSALDNNKNGPDWLKKPEIAGIVAKVIRSLDGHLYNLDAFCIMPNHVHLVCTPFMLGDGFVSVPSIMQKIKGLTARQINLQLGRQGQFWQHESYDHVVRDDQELLKIIDYVLNNPVRAGLVPEWTYNRFEFD
ncbi:MAG TPA: transposase [Bellilinea sp.]|nr:transposase [Bellilinea sp.]